MGHIMGDLWSNLAETACGILLLKCAVSPAPPLMWPKGYGMRKVSTAGQPSAQQLKDWFSMAMPCLCRHCGATSTLGSWASSEAMRSIA